ncbi:MAG: NAD(P)H-dependent glycerol-3-phosphate dehydrogenase, partial [Nannocystaceae bacterium]
SHGMRGILEQVAPLCSAEASLDLLIAAKGIEGQTLLSMFDLAMECFAGAPGIHVSVLGGPSFAREVAMESPTVVVFASPRLEAAKRLQLQLSTEAFRVYVTADVVGVELGGALKNVIALAAGMCDGAGLGTNARAALITRGLAEITRLGVAMGADASTFAGLAGLGDLVLTCTGSLSRNRRVGLALGRGEKIEDVIAEMGMVAEGVKNTANACSLAARHGVAMPIVEVMDRILRDQLTVEEAVRALMLRELKEEPPT